MRFGTDGGASMNRVETFPVSIRCYADPDIRTLMMEHGGVAAAGRWLFLLALLYDSDGCIKLNELNVRVICDTLDLEEHELDAFLASCADRGFIDRMMLEERGEIISQGVIKQIEYIEKKANARRKKKEGEDE